MGDVDGVLVFLVYLCFIILLLGVLLSETVEDDRLVCVFDYVIVSGDEWWGFGDVIFCFFVVFPAVFNVIDDGVDLLGGSSQQEFLPVVSGHHKL